MRRSGNCEENKRIIMDLDVVLKSHSCPYIVHCIGTFILTVSVLEYRSNLALLRMTEGLYYLVNGTITSTAEIRSLY
jgi:hypothetical protein